MWGPRKRVEGIDVVSLMMRLRILSWNERGANDLEKRRIIKAFIRSKEVDIVSLQETKLKKMTGGLIRSLGWADIWIGLLSVQ